MASLSFKIKAYAKSLGVSDIDWRTDVLLQNDSDERGEYINEWNLSIDEPTTEQLASYETAATTEKTLQTVLNNRANDYPSIADQLDKIYHLGLDEWKKVIKATKDKYPK